MVTCAGFLLGFLGQQVWFLDQQVGRPVLGYMETSLVHGTVGASLEPGFTVVGLVLESVVKGLSPGSA